jgi:hypothetical protein
MSFNVNSIDDIGNTLSPYMQIVFHDSIPEYLPLSPSVRPRPAQEAPERKKIL